MCGWKKNGYGAVTIRARAESFFASSYGQRFSSRENASNSEGDGSFWLNRSLRVSRSDCSTRA